MPARWCVSACLAAGLAFAASFMAVVALAGYGLGIASRHGRLIHSDHDVGRSLLWTLGPAGCIGLVAAVLAFRLACRWLGSQPGRG